LVGEQQTNWTAKYKYFWL